MAAHSSILAWRIPRTEEPGGLESMGPQLDTTEVSLFATPFIEARQAPLSMGFPRQESWSGLLFPPLGDLSYPGIKPTFLVLQADSLLLSHQGRPNFFFF